MIRKMPILVATFCLMAGIVSGSLAEQEEDVKELVRLTAAEEMLIHSQQVARTPQEILDNPIAAQAYGDKDAAYLHRIHPYAYYFPVAVSGTGDKVQLHDASLWYVHPSQRYLVKKWVQSDALFIKPNAACFSLYKYVLQNRVTADVVEVNLIERPIDTGAYTHWITDIDWYSKWVYLNDGSAWKINASDYAFKKWQVGHRLIVGVNNHWRTTEYPHVLINTNIYNVPYCEADVY